MERIAVIAGLILLLAIGGIFAINGQRGNSSSLDGTGSVKVGMLMTGSREDSSWNEAHWEGIQAAAQELGLDIDCRENLSSDDCSQIVDDMIHGGCKIIISTSIEFQPEIVAEAEEHPQTYFFQATGTQERPNLISYMGRMYQMRYLAGVIAGLQSKSGAVGYVAVEPIPEVVRGVDAFTLGVRKANHEAKVYVAYTHIWSEDSITRKVTEKLLDSHPQIDVIGMHVDTYGALDIAQQRGIYAVGCNVDKQMNYPETFLTAPIWNWSIFYKDYVREALNNKFEGGTYLFGADTGIVDLAPLQLSHGRDMDRTLSIEQHRLIDGEADVFYGPIRDNQGNLRVAAGENLSDQTLFQDLDWYVEGVVQP